MAKIKIPPVLRASTGGEREVSAEGDNVGAVLNALADAHPATRTFASSTASRRPSAARTRS
jgi:molybdopterin synthase sulfur carrier subunit